jgi:hypothetical protein
MDEVTTRGLTMHTFQKAQPSLEAAEDEPMSRSPLSRETGLVVSYPDQSYADHKGLTLLSHLRQYLPNAEYHEALPARILDCCREVRSQVRVEHPVQREMTGAFEFGEQSFRFRVLSLLLNRRSDRVPVLILLDAIRRT